MKKVSPIFIKKIKLFLFPVITILLVIVLIARFLLPKIEEIKQAFDKNSKDKETLVALETKVKKLTDLKNSTLTVDFQRAESVLPSDKNVPIIFASISQLERTTGVQIEDFSIKPGVLSKTGEKKTGANVENITFNLTVLGSEAQVLTFMENILKNAPLFNIGSITLYGSGGVDKLTMDVSTYYQNLPENLGKVDSPLPELSESQKKASALIQSFNVTPFIPEQLTQQASPSGELSGKSIFDL